VATALLPAVLVHGLLGARPDAAFGRLRLAPALPAPWTAFRVTGIRLGEARLELAYRADEERHTFVLRPTAGRVPATVIFEPTVPGVASSIELDEAPVDLPVEQIGDRSQATLQIPLDRERSVSLVRTRP
jgi:hypothetical protein